MTPSNKDVPSAQFILGSVFVFHKEMFKPFLPLVKHEVREFLESLNIMVHVGLMNGLKGCKMYGSVHSTPVYGYNDIFDTFKKQEAVKRKAAEVLLDSERITTMKETGLHGSTFYSKAKHDSEQMTSQGILKDKFTNCYTKHFPQVSSRIA